MSIKSILRTVIASGLVVGAVAALSPAAFAVGETNSSDNTQSGTIAPVATVEYAAGSSLTINTGTDQTDVSFGTVTVQNNNNAGWELFVASANGSILKNGSIGSIPYALKVDGASVSGLTAVATPVSAKDVTSLTAATNGGVGYLVKGSIAGTDTNGKPSGTYSDTLTFTLTNH